MSKFMVHTDVFAKDLDSVGFTMSVPQLLQEAKLSQIAFKTAYICPYSICHCVKDRKIVCEFDSPDQETLRTALTKIGLPATAILAKPN